MQRRPNSQSDKIECFAETAFFLPRPIVATPFFFSPFTFGLMILTRRADSVGLRKHHALLDDVRKLLTKVIRQAIGNSEGILVFFRTN
jgi:hypothetical protein